jgi:hypothetical protein
MSEAIKVVYDPQQVKQITRAFKAMSDEAVEKSKKVGYELASLMLQRIQSAASNTQEQRIGATGRASKSSKIGEFSFGYQRQAFSGGAFTTKNLKGDAPYGRGILAGVEFGSAKSPQFRPRSPRLGNGNTGYWIYPTLRKNQPEIIKRWEEAFEDILKEFGNG